MDELEKFILRQFSMVHFSGSVDDLRNLRKCIIQLFTNDPDVVNYGVKYLKIAALIGPVYPIFFITNAFFQGIKKPIYSTYINLLRIVVLPFVTMWVMLNYFQGDFEDLFLGLLAINWIFGISVLMLVKYVFLKKLTN